MATKEAYRKQAHDLAAENAELKAQVDQEIKNWKARNRSACEAEQEVVRLKELLAERDPESGPWFRRDEFARDVIEIVYGVLKDDSYSYGERCEIAMDSILKSGLAPPSHSPQSVLSSQNVGKDISKEGQSLSKNHERTADEHRTGAVVTSQMHQTQGE
jgi:hypothetical protein